MIKKIVFAGCSITAGTELYEEKFIPGYTSMSRKQFTKIKYPIPEHQISEHNKRFAYPSLVGDLLNVEIENIAERGISNKEIAMRVMMQFPQERYNDVIAVIQITTHNRMLLKYKDSLVSSAVIQPVIPTHFLNGSQNNILQEFFLEFFSESVSMAEDYMSILHAVHFLKSKNVPCYLTRISPTDLNQPLAEPHMKDESLILNEQSPLALDSVKLSLLNEFNKFKLTNQSLEEITLADYLPQWHFTYNSHKLIASHLAEKIKCLHS
jgi:hypothetical protein